MSKETITDLKDEIIDLFEEALADHGQNKRVGTIYANLVASQKSLTQNELAENLEISNSTVSRGLSSLEDRFGLIKSKRLPGTKKAEYSISEKTFDKLLTIGILELYQQYRKIGSRIKSIKAKYEPSLERKSNQKQSKFYLDMLNSIETSINFHVQKLGKLTNELQEMIY
ncbi:MAG: HTH domain-containing protein [Candidatus Kariarchaeaceae archaeon]|jgi:DNA-binding transcriptional regulator GbsR (MarR family)